MARSGSGGTGTGTVVDVVVSARPELVDAPFQHVHGRRAGTATALGVVQRGVAGRSFLCKDMRRQLTVLFCLSHTRAQEHNARTKLTCAASAPLVFLICAPCQTLSPLPVCSTLWALTVHSIRVRVVAACS